MKKLLICMLALALLAGCAPASVQEPEDGKLHIVATVFPAYDFARATAGTALDNRPSVALLSSLGFTQTATESVSFYQDSAGNPIVFTGGVFEKPLP